MITLLVSLLFNISNSSSCDFNKEIKSVYSLSGSVTLALRDLGLLKNKKLLGISSFHPVPQKDFNGKFLPGGIFLSHETIQTFSDGVLFYDESRELSRIFNRYKSINAIEIKTRSLTPLESAISIEKQLKPFLVGCDLEGLTSKLKLKTEKLKGLVRNDSTYIFFVGPIKNKKRPELVMVQDGFVKWLLQEKLIKSYPSELSYVNWSARIMNNLLTGTVEVGVRDSGSSMEIGFKKEDHIINLTYPGALIPGTGQIDAMIYMFQNI